ncbi:hypothetical protein GCM10027169_07190 [Gordonia jinhuaensis]|uniref:WXG100 family type VII secretion target n=1 Tax=Gordonia jinhuaensis TaxID=1517702 RepID=A0A916SWR8_9ACTN|nr:hypothetical protein [Gordonia jinhuaensis]GGB21268.1 hypothetical protein GCM10011489_06790 [Gordonia jinhuaensis]
MGSGEFFADLEGLAASARAFSNTHDRLQTLLGKISSEIDSKGTEVWGDDEPGGTFGYGYTEAHDNGRANIEHASQALGAAADGVRRTEEFLFEQETANAAGVTQAGLH